MNNDKKKSGFIIISLLIALGLTLLSCEETKYLYQFNTDNNRKVGITIYLDKHFLGKHHNIYAKDSIAKYLTRECFPGYGLSFYAPVITFKQIESDVDKFKEGLYQFADANGSSSLYSYIKGNFFILTKDSIIIDPYNMEIKVFLEQNGMKKKRVEKLMEKITISKDCEKDFLYKMYRFEGWDTKKLDDYYLIRDKNYNPIKKDTIQ